MTDQIRESLSERSPLPFFVGGRWAHARAGTTTDVIGPSTGELLATAALGDAEDIRDAVAAARLAFPSWAALSGAERAALIRRFANTIEANIEEIGTLESLDAGKPIGDAIGFDIPVACNAYRYFADLAEEGQRRDPLTVDGIDATEAFVPRGVCGFIVPWNAPVLLTSWGIAPALAAGNTVVVKPAEQTPLTALRLAELAEEVGFPAGVLNCVPGLGAVAGAALVRDPGVDMISFTGSPRVGHDVAAAAAARLIPSKLELGGKGAAVVFDDVDVPATAQALAEAVTLNAGQVCCTATRWLVHESVFDELAARAAGVLSAMRIGPGDDERTQLGPVSSRAQLARVLDYLSAGAKQGARFLLEGGPAEVEGHPGGFYVKPALMTGEPDNVCAQEEIFGPVAYLIPFRDEDEAVAMVNASDYGLANSVWSRDLERAHRVAERLVSGSTWINAHNLFAYGLPYGGVNRSGWGGGVNARGTFFDYQRRVVVAGPR